MTLLSNSDTPTFGNFIATPASGQAVRLALALAERRFGAPRLLLLHGPPGTGKTHLLRAITHLALEKHPSLPTLRTTAMDWVADLISHIQSSEQNDMPHVWPRDAVVTLDDLHVLSGRPATQSEIGLQLLSALEQGCRLACAVGHPNEIPELTEVLRRQRGVHFVRLGHPTRPEMREILGAMAGDLSPRSLDSMASTCHGDVRRAVSAIARRRLEASMARLAQSMP